MRATPVGVGFAHCLQFSADDFAHLLGRFEQGGEVFDHHLQILVFLFDLFAFQGRQAAQGHIQDGLGLDFAQPVFFYQASTRGIDIRRLADQSDDVVQVFEGHQQALQNMGALASLLQVVFGAPAHDLQAVFDIDTQGMLEAQHARLAIHQGQHDDAESALHGGALVEVLQHTFRVGRFTQLDDDAHALAVGFVAQVGDALQAFFTRQLGDALDERGLVGHIGQFGDDDAAAAALHLFQMGVGLHGDAPAPGAVGAEQPVAIGGLQDHAAGGKIRPLDEAHQVFDAEIVHLVPVFEHVVQRIDYLTQVVGRDAGSHTDGDAGAAVDQQIGEGGGQDERLGQGAIEVVTEIDGVFVNIGQHMAGGGVQAGLGITHGGRRIAVDAAEVALPIHQQAAHGEILRHARHGLVNGGVAVGVVFTQHFTDDAGGFFVIRVGAQTHIVHGVQDAPVDGFEAIAGIGQRPGDDDAHGVI